MHAWEVILVSQRQKKQKKIWAVGRYVTMLEKFAAINTTKTELRQYNLVIAVDITGSSTRRVKNCKVRIKRVHVIVERVLWGFRQITSESVNSIQLACVC